jgi:HK97 family phage prohead protease
VTTLETRVTAAKRYIRDNSPRGIERSRTPFAVEVRAAQEADSLYTLVGHGAVFNSRSENLGGFIEVIAPGAFGKVLRSRNSADCRCLWGHQSELVLASRKNGTLALREDNVGLYYEARVADVSYARDLQVLLERGDVDQSSFAFSISRDGETWQDDPQGTGLLLRTITEFSGLWDVSPVTFPAYMATDSGVKASLPSRQSNGEAYPHRAAAARRLRLRELDARV